MTRTRIHLLTLLLFVATFSAWAAQVSTTVEFGQVAQYTEQSYDNAGVMANGEARTLVIYSAGTNSSQKLTVADDGYNSGAGASKLGNNNVKATNLEAVDASGHKKYFIKFSALKDEQVRLYYFSSSALTTMNTFALSHTTASYDETVVGDEGCKDGTKQLYYVDFTIPADGTYYINVYNGSSAISVSGIKFTYQEAGTVIAKAALTAKDAYEAAGWYVDPTQKTVKATEFNTSSVDITATYDGKKGYRLNGTGNYVGVAVNGTTFQEGDVLNVFVTKVPGQGTLAVYADNAGTELIYDTESFGVLGNNRITLPAAANGKTVLYVARTASNTWNGNIYSIEVSRADIPYQMLFGYTWTATALTTTTNAEFDMTTTGVLRAGSAIKGVSGASGALAYTSNSSVNMLSLNKVDNYIELTTTEDLQAGDEIVILGYAGAADKNYGLCIEPTTVNTYKSNNTTTLKTSTIEGRVLHAQYTAELTEEWLTANNITNQLRIFRSTDGSVGIEKIDIIRHQRELTAQTVISGIINGEALTTERINSLNTTTGHNISLSGAYHATIVLNVAQTYMLDGDPANTRVINKEITLTEGEIDAEGQTPYTATVGEITYKVTLKPFAASDVTSGRTWTWSSFSKTTSEMTDGTFPKKNTDVVMANITGKENGAQYLTIAGQYAVTEKNNGGSSEKVKCFVGNIIKFTTTVPGIVRATWVANGTTERVLTINGIATTKSSSATTDEYITTEDIYVPAGEVVIQCALTDGTSSKQYFRLTELKFQATEAATVRSGLTAGKFGTICLAKDAYNATGATFYNLEYTDGSSITLIEHTGVLKAGMPYVFLADAAEITVAYKNMTEATEGKNHNGLHGTLTAMEAGSLEGKYFISNNEVRACGAGATLAAGRAYINIDEIPTIPSEAPGRRCVLGADRLATALENAEAETVARKVLKDGQVLIIRQGHTYTPDGRIF